MHAFPLVSAQELDAARTRWGEEHPACAALAAEAGALGPDDLAAAAQAPAKVRDALHVQTVLLDCSLAFALGGDHDHLERVQAVIGAAEQHPDSPVHAAVHTIGLAVAWALCGDAVDGEIILTVVGDAAPTIAAFAHGRRPDDRRPEVAVAWAGLGTAALLRDGHDSRAERWRDEALRGLVTWWEHAITPHGVAHAGLNGCGTAFRQAAPLLMAARRLGHFDVADPGANPAADRLALVPAWYALELATRSAPAAADHQAFGGFLPVFSAIEPALTGWVHRHGIGADGDGSYGADARLHRSTVFESVLWPPADGNPQLPEAMVDLEAGLVLERPGDGRTGLRVSCAHGSQTSLFDADGTMLLSAGGSPQDGVVRVDGQIVDPQPGRLVGVARTPDIMVATLDLTPRASCEEALVRHVVRHIAHVRRPVPYLLIVDDAARVDVTESTFQQILRGPPRAQTSQTDANHLDVTLPAARSELRLIALDDDAAIAVDDASRRDERDVWSVSRRVRHALMGVLAIPGNGVAATVEGRVDRRAGRAVVRWGDGETTEDVLDFHPTTAELATFSRDGQRPPAETRVLRDAALNSAPPAAVVAADERRQRRMRRLVEALDAIAAAEDYPMAPDRGVIMGGASFKFIGREFLSHFVSLGELDPDADVLDVGCGGGRMAAALLYFLHGGSYRGFDVHQPSIEWCRRHVQTRDERFEFAHVDIENPLYHPDSGSDPAHYRFPYDAERFDFVIATSLFTHMFRAETAHYLREFARVLRPGGMRRS
ncbi:MAG: class I SAM-dependent methyltransferase [Solirubrobacteraceae bacterium]